jgi:hypothetical protein
MFSDKYDVNAVFSVENENMTAELFCYLFHPITPLVYLQQVTQYIL